MNIIRVTKIFFFESAHALHAYDGKCKNIHGHSYKLSVTVAGETLDDALHVKNGMVMDFGDLKRIVKKEIVDVFDHATILNARSSDAEVGKFLQKKGHKLLLVDYQPTSEMMLLDFANRLKKEMPEGVKLHSLRLYETATSYAEWYASDNE